MQARGKCSVTAVDHDVLSDTEGGQPLRARGRFTTVRHIIHFIGAIVLILALSACGFLNPAKQVVAPTTAGSHGYTPSISSATYEEGICIDPTLSTDTAFSATIKSIVVGVVSGWAAAPSAPSDSTPIPSEPGLDLYVRQVETDSFDSNNVALHLAIPAVPGLKVRPSATSSAFLADDPMWRRAASAIATTATAASQSATHDAAAINNMVLETWQNSEIVGCVSALAETVPQGPRSFILASDLEENEPPQITGDLHGTRILVIQPCDGTAASCAALQTSWRALFANQGATDITFIRPEDAAQVLPTFMKETP
jgi:hypothetical protein